MTTTDMEVVSEDINILPDELIMYIFKLLSLDAILVCENVCQRWKKLARDVTLWRNIIVVYSGKPGQSESAKNLEIIQSHCEYISCIKLQYVYSYPVITSILEKCDNLVSLELVMCRICKEFEVDIARWPNLKKLNMKNSLLLHSSADLNIQYDQFKYLNYLSLSEFGLNSTNRESLLCCKYLSHIYIEKIRGLDLEFIKKLILAQQKILETFHIYGDDAVNNECLKMLSHCPMLKDLGIIRCENLTDEGLIALTNLKYLKHLQIWNNANFTEANLLRALGSPTMVTLESLSLSKIGNMSPVIVDVISEYYKNLKFLAVYCCPRILNTDYEKQLKSKFRNIDVVLY